MSTNSPTELKSFSQFVEEQVNNPDVDFTPEECLQLWRLQSPSQDILQESVQAIKRAQKQLTAGEGQPLSDVIAQIRSDNNLT